MARQVRAARSLLNWNRQDLAKRAFVSVTTIRRLETEDFTQFRRSIPTLQRGMETLEEFGIVFIDAEPKAGLDVGVRLKHVPFADTIIRHHEFGLKHGCLEDDTVDENED